MAHVRLCTLRHFQPVYLYHYLLFYILVTFFLGLGAFFMYNCFEPTGMWVGALEKPSKNRRDLIAL